MMLIVIVLSGFSAIRLAHSQPILAMIYIAGGSTCVLFYTAIFQLAYQVTGRPEELRRVIQVKAEGLRGQKEKELVRVFLKSVPTLAIYVGGFQRVERESIPIFVDFVSQQIVGLLVSFN